MVRLLLALALLTAPSALAGSTHATGTIPTRGTFIPGVSLAGVSLGMTATQVKQHWGQLYQVCPTSKYCTTSKPVWLFTYQHGEPLGVAAKFDGKTGKTVAVFTIGTIEGWKTIDGLKMFDPVSAMYSLYQTPIYSKCIGFEAFSYKKGNTITSFYTASGVIYGFALTDVHEPICE